MMKRLSAMLLVGVLICGLAACSSGDKGTPASDGAVVGTGEGTGIGTIKVEVTLSSDKTTIEDVKVVEQNETPDIGGKAIEPLTASVLENQSVDFAAISGATLTSEGFRTALEAALTAAGADVANFKA